MEQKSPFESSNGLRVTNRTSQSISLEWPVFNTYLVSSESTDTESKSIERDDVPEISVPQKSVSNATEGEEIDLKAKNIRVKQRDGNWIEIQMTTDQTTDWTFVYKGYGNHCIVDGLAPDLALIFRMKQSKETEWGTEVEASTAPSPASTEDLNRAVEMNSDYLVSRILNLTRSTHLKKILKARDRNGMTSLMVACHIGNVSIAEKLVKMGCEIDAESSGARRTPLMFACIMGHQNIVTLLDRNKANWRHRDKSGSSAMDYSINGGHIGILRLAFCRLGSKCINEKDDRHGWTPLMKAAILSDNLDVLRFLINKGANPNSTDHSQNKSVLLSAILRKKPKFVKYLLEAGADPHFQTQSGKNCFEISRILGYREITEIIKDHIRLSETKLTG